MAALVAALFIRVTDRSADWVAAASKQSGQPTAILTGAGIALVVTHAIAAVAGFLVGQYLTPNPRQLMLGLMLIAAATGAVWPGRSNAPTVRRPVFGTAAHMVATGIGGRGEAVTFAIAAGGIAALAGVGGAIGSFAVLAFAATVGEVNWRSLPHRAIGIGIACILCVSGICLALAALRLI